MIKLLISNPDAREAIKQQVGTPVEMMNALGYGLFTGRKPK
jgi:hypothetical protein